MLSCLLPALCRRVCALGFLVVLCVGSVSCALLPGKAEGNVRSRSSVNSARLAAAKTEPLPFYLWPLAALIRHHREVTTKMDGPRCPLYPTCSAWGQQILEKKGALGVFYIIDRLFYREFGPLHKHYVPAPRRLSRHLRYYDPIKDAFSEPGPSLLRDDF